MLNHIKPYVEKIHYVDTGTNRACRLHKLDVKRWSLCGGGFSLSAVGMLIDQQYFAKTTMEYISLPSNLNAIVGIKSYYCAILKMVILHDAIKTIQNRVYVIYLNKEQKPVSFQKTKKTGFKKICQLCFSNTLFFNPEYLPILFL